MNKEISQKELWEKQHEKRAEESREIENKPNAFAMRCAQLIPENSKVLEIGSANGRDARYFAKEKGGTVIAIDFSFNAVDQLRKASSRDHAKNMVFPLVAEAQNLPLNHPESIDAFYARSALHLSDNDLDRFFKHLLLLLKSGGFIMIEGKTESDPKIARSEEITPNLFRNGDAHIRRLWTKQLIEKIVEKHGLKLIEIGVNTEIWNDQETKFINFIAQKK